MPSSYRKLTATDMLHMDADILVQIVCVRVFVECGLFLESMSALVLN